MNPMSIRCNILHMAQASVTPPGSSILYKYQYQIGISIVSFQNCYTDTAYKYKIDLTASCSSPHKGTLLFIKEIV